MVNLKELINVFEQHSDKERAVQMKAYLRDQFEFLGIAAPTRKQLWSPYFKEAKKTKEVDWEFVDICWDNDYRELQYAAVYYLKHMQKFLTAKDLEKIKSLAVRKSWWDTIDIFDRIIGDIALRYPEVTNTLLEWSVDNNIWLRRIAIDHQLLRKEKTDKDLLEKIIVNNLGSNEFFINKAIGWSLRDYSKCNPEWVKDFISRYEDKMSNLSIREASKYI